MNNKIQTEEIIRMLASYGATDSRLPQYRLEDTTGLGVFYVVDKAAIEMFEQYIDQRIAQFISTQSELE